MGRKRTRAPAQAKSDPRGVRDRLLRSGETLFAEGGLHRTQVSHIAKAAEVSVGTFYRYFRDKDELYLSLVSAKFDAYMSSLRELLDHVPGLTVFERVDVIRQVFRRTFTVHTEDPHTFMLWHRHGLGASETVARKLDQFTKQLEQLITDVLDRTLTVGGMLDEQTRRTIASSMIGMAHTMVYRMITEEAPTIDDAVNVCTHLVIGGLMGFAPPDRYELLMNLYRQETQARQGRAPNTSVAPGGSHGA